MDLTLVIVLLILLILLLLASVLLYYFTQQDLKNIAERLNTLDVAKSQATPRKADGIRRERSAALDKLALLEASFSATPREELTPEELDTYEQCRRAIKTSIAELKRSNEWMGLPFDLEWAEVQERLPRLTGLYRRAVELALKEAEGSS